MPRTLGRVTHGCFRWDWIANPTRERSRYVLGPGECSTSRRRGQGVPDDRVLRYLRARRESKAASSSSPDHPANRTKSSALKLVDASTHVGPRSQGRQLPAQGQGSGLTATQGLSAPARSASPYGLASAGGTSTVTRQPDHSGVVHISTAEVVRFSTGVDTRPAQPLGHEWVTAAGTTTFTGFAYLDRAMRNAEFPMIPPYHRHRLELKRPSFSGGRRQL